MAKLTRKTQRLFGSSAGANQIAQFGSFAANSPLFSSDPAVIQSLSNFLTGWFGAAVGANSPAIEDMNGLFLVAFYQLAYLMQAGVAEYDTGTTYYTGSLAMSAGQIYVSQVDNNTNNALSNRSFWIPFSGGSPTSGSGALFWLQDVSSAVYQTNNSRPTFLFGAGLGQQLFADLKVPLSYVAGQPISMNLPFYSAGTSGTALLQTISTLIRMGTDLITSTTNQHTSTNTAVTMSGATQNKPQQVVFDITDSSGKINGVTVSPGDLITIELTRGTDSCTNDLIVLPYASQETYQ